MLILPENGSGEVWHKDEVSLCRTVKTAILTMASARPPPIMEPASSAVGDTECSGSKLQRQRGFDGNYLDNKTSGCQLLDSLGHKLHGTERYGIIAQRCPAVTGSQSAAANCTPRITPSDSSRGAKPVLAAIIDSGVRASMQRDDLVLL